MTISTGFMLSPERRGWLYRRIKRPLPLALFDLSMLGHRIMIAQDKASEMARGVIHKPRTTVEQEQRESGSGYIIGVGPLVGKPGAPHPVGIECDDPRELLGLHCYYASWTGKVFRTDEDDEEFRAACHLVIMTDRDIQSIDQGVETELTEAEEEAIRKALSQQGLV